MSLGEWPAICVPSNLLVHIWKQLLTFCCIYMAFRSELHWMDSFFFSQRNCLCFGNSVPWSTGYSRITWPRLRTMFQRTSDALTLSRQNPSWCTELRSLIPKTAASWGSSIQCKLLSTKFNVFHATGFAQCYSRFTVYSLTYFQSLNSYVIMPCWPSAGTIQPTGALNRHLVVHY